MLYMAKVKGKDSHRVHDFHSGRVIIMIRHRAVIIKTDQQQVTTVDGHLAVDEAFIREHHEDHHEDVGYPTKSSRQQGRQSRRKSAWETYHGSKTARLFNNCRALEQYTNNSAKTNRLTMLILPDDKDSKH